MKRQRVDSVAGAISTLQGAMSEIEPPAGVKISAALRPYWQIITSNKAASLWNNYDLFIAYEIANTMYRLSQANDQLHKLDLPAFDKERLEVEKLCDLLAKRIRLLSAHVQCHSEATAGKSGKTVARNKAHHEAAKAVSSIGGGLIPGLSEYQNR